MTVTATTVTEWPGAAAAVTVTGRAAAQPEAACQRDYLIFVQTLTTLGDSDGEIIMSASGRGWQGMRLDHVITDPPGRRSH